MSKRLPNPNLVKIHRSYTTDEAARLLGIHKNTVSNWIKNEGLLAITDQRPYLVPGIDLKEFLMEKRSRAKIKTPPGHIYCLKCRAPRQPSEGLFDYEPIGLNHGRVIAFCVACETAMYRAIRKTDLPNFEAALLVTETTAEQRITKRD